MKILKNVLAWFTGKTTESLNKEDVIQLEVGVNSLNQWLRNISKTDEAIREAIQNMNEAKGIDASLVSFLKANWVQKQFDDLLLMNQSVMQSLKRSPFDKTLLQKRDKIHHDINKLQPIVLQTGIACGELIEKEFGVSFCLLTGKDRPVAPKEEQKASGIVLPGQ